VLLAKKDDMTVIDVCALIAYKAPEGARADKTPRGVQEPLQL